MSELLKYFSGNKKTLFFVAVLALVLLALPSSFIEAGPEVCFKAPFDPPEKEVCYDLCEGCGLLNPVQCAICTIQYLVSLPIRLFFAQYVGMFGLGAIIFGLIYSIVAAVTDWLIGVSMSVGTVPGGDFTPRVVTIGWNISRQIANLFFILALAFIGLATILRIKEYEAKKALPNLIITALLINFTPVLVGFVVDLGNIVTKFFTDEAGSPQGFLNIMIAAIDYIVYSMVHIFLEDGLFWQKFVSIMGGFFGILIYGAVLSIFFIVASSVYLVIAMIFFFRIIMLWILMILSPIAFLSRIFPPGKTTKMIFPGILHWDQWWEKLIQWTIIGIPISFFLYLSHRLCTDMNVTDIFRTDELENRLLTVHGNIAISFPELGAQFVELFTSLLAPTLCLALLIMGILISITAAPEGARGFLQAVKEGGRKVALKHGPRALRRVFRDPMITKGIYDRYRQRGNTRRDALKLTALSVWRRRPRPSAAPITVKGKTVVPAGRKAQVARAVIGAPLQIIKTSKQTIKMSKPIARGSLNVFKDIIRESIGAGLKKSVGIKPPQGISPHPCPSCGHRPISLRADRCPACGHLF